MLVMGIDPGTATTGYGLVSDSSDGTLQVIDFGIITTPAEMAMPDRLGILFDRLNELLLLHQPDEGAVEKLFFERNVTTAISVGQARGVALLAFSKSKIPIGEYTPLQVKQAICGYGGADKRQVQEMVRALLCLEDIPRPDDAADALAIAICHLNHHTFSSVIHDQSS